MNAMRPGLPDPLINLLGARGAMGAPVAAAAWFGETEKVGFALADGTLAIAGATWDGAPRLQPRQGGGVELVPATATAPPVMRQRVHEGPYVMVADGTGGLLAGGRDGRLTRIAADGRVETLAEYPGASISHVAAASGARACAAGLRVHRFVRTAGSLDCPGDVAALAFNRAGDRLAVAHAQGVTVWDGETRRGLPAQAFAPVSMAWSPATRTLVGGLRENALVAWRWPEGTPVAMGATPTPPLSLSFAGDDAVLAASGDTRVVCWRFDAAGGEARRAECGIGSTASVVQVAWHPRRAVIAAGYENGAVLLCQPGSAEVLFVREAGGGAVTALAWSPDGAFLALAAAAGEIGVVAFPERLFRAGPVTTPDARMTQRSAQP